MCPEGQHKEQGSVQRTTGGRYRSSAIDQRATLIQGTRLMSASTPPRLTPLESSRHSTIESMAKEGSHTPPGMKPNPFLNVKVPFFMHISHVATITSSLPVQALWVP